jgi:dihydroorotate dehydrogenase electron transfer subunit
MSTARIDLLIATSAGYDEIVRAAMALSDAQARRALVLFGAETFAFRPRPSTILVPHMPAGVIACVPALEEFGIASRLASTAGLPGCHDGTVEELAEIWLGALGAGDLDAIHISVSGAEATVSAVRALGHARRLPVVNIPSQADSP